MVSLPTPDDLVDVVELCIGTLEPHAGADWSSKASDLEWSCRATLEHLASLAYAQQLAVRATAFRPLALSVATEAPIEQLLWTARVAGLVLAQVARAAPPTARGFHPAGMADASGFVAMGIDEILIHTHDISTGLGAQFAPSAASAKVVLDRLFPWWPREADPWEALLWANGRRSLPDHPNPGAAWLWHCAPVDEWDGVVPRWDPEENRPAKGQ